ncbi:MAG: hypothetical protein RLZZ126_1608 [Pseudomonadota bacterium]|jgi:tetratricopeptide (TPR) repeat protein
MELTRLFEQKMTLKKTISHRFGDLLGPVKLRRSAPWMAVALACVISPVQAQYLEEVSWRLLGAEVVAQIRLVTPVQYSRTVGAQGGDQVQIHYRVLPNAAKIADLVSEKRLAASNQTPSLVVTDEAETSVSHGTILRKLVVRIGDGSILQARPGRDERSIELVVSVPKANFAASTALPMQVGRYFITLESLAGAGQSMSASIPASLQNHQVFTRKRSEEAGKELVDVNVGYFATPEEAEAARQLVLGRFPTAEIHVGLPPEAPLPAPQQELSGTTQLAAASAEVEETAKGHLGAAQTAFDGGDYVLAIERLGKLLDLPQNASSRRAQELIGLARLNSGDRERARVEFELFLKLHPSGPDADRTRQLLAAFPSVAAPGPGSGAQKAAAVSTTSGSFSTFYYGGKSDVRTQEFRNSVLGGLPVLQSDATLSNVDQRLIQSNLDLSWRYKDSDKDMRFVFRDAYSSDLMPNGSNRERLSALFFEHRSLVNGTSIRVGRQSPSGGGVLYRFDGVQAGYSFKPDWRVTAVAGTPSDPLLDTKRYFYGLSVEAEHLTKEISGSAYAIQQTIDGEIDRRSVGFDLRYLRGGLSTSMQVDFDPMLDAVNILAVQANWQANESTLVNAMFDRRTTPVLSLGNVLFFQDPALAVPARRIQDLLGTTPIETLRAQAKGLSAYQTQARLSVTTALNAKWQVGADVGMTNVDELKPVPVLLPAGQPGTGNLWSVGAQLIGSNLYSGRDTHVLSVSQLGGPTYRGTLLAYNNMSVVKEVWQFEPSLKMFLQDDVSGSSIRTMAAGLRLTYRIHQKIALESDLNYERSESLSAPVGGVSSVTSSNRFSYSFGGRYDF